MTITKLELQAYDIHEELKRIGIKICNDGLEELTVHSNPDEIVIHNTRKRIKFLRALLRLVKYEVDNVVFSSQNNFLRHIKNLSTKQREIVVLEKTILQLLATSSKTSTILFLQNLLAAVELEKMKINADPPHTELVERYKRLLIVYRNLIREWDFSFRDIKMIVRGVYELYFKARRLLVISKKSRDVHHLHDLRKRTKDIYHILSMLRPASEAELTKTIIKFKKLSDLLGDIHDLFTIPEYIKHLRPEEINSTAYDRIYKRISRRIETRIEKSFLLSDEIYGQTPYQFRIYLYRKLRKFASRGFKPKF